MEGLEQCVDHVLPAEANRAVHILDEQLHMQVSSKDGTSQGKTVAKFWSRELASAAAARMSKLGVNVAKKVENLGVQFSAGST